MEMNSRCFTWFPNCLVLGEPNIYHDLGDFTRMWEDCGGLSDCEELVGGDVRFFLCRLLHIEHNY